MENQPNKILIIRFSSFGDIIQGLSLTKPLRQSLPQSEIHWLTKAEFSRLVELSSDIDRVLSFKKVKGLWGLFRLAFSLRKEKYDLVYDAHANIRSFLLRWVLFSGKTKIIKRPKNRWRRFLLFKWRINKFPWPFKGMLSYSEPLIREGIFPESAAKDLTQDLEFPKDTREEVKQYISQDGPPFLALAPSAAWEMKRWPLEHWKELVKKFSQQFPSVPIYIIGGPEDDFCREIAQVSESAVNLAGKLSLLGSCEVVKRAKLLISADTGAIHVADLLGVSGLSLIGPTAFGFPTNPQIRVVSVELPCRPCTKDGRGHCVQDVYKKCLVDITPDRVYQLATEYFEK